MLKIEEGRIFLLLGPVRRNQSNCIDKNWSGRVELLHESDDSTHRIVRMCYPAGTFCREALTGEPCLHSAEI